MTLDEIETNIRTLAENKRFMAEQVGAARDLLAELLMSYETLCDLQAREYTRLHKAVKATELEDEELAAAEEISNILEKSLVKEEQNFKQSKKKPDPPQGRVVSEFWGEIPSDCQVSNECVYLDKGRCYNCEVAADSNGGGCVGSTVPASKVKSEQHERYEKQTRDVLNGSAARKPAKKSKFSASPVGLEPLKAVRCKHWDCGYCYADKSIKTNAVNGGCFKPQECPTNKGD